MSNFDDRFHEADEQACGLIHKFKLDQVDDYVLQALIDNLSLALESRELAYEQESNYLR